MLSTAESLAARRVQDGALLKHKFKLGDRIKIVKLIPAVIPNSNDESGYIVGNEGEIVDIDWNTVPFQLYGVRALVDNLEVDLCLVEDEIVLVRERPE